MRICVFDIETNGLDPDKIWYIVCKTYPDGGESVYTSDTLGVFREFASTVDTFVGHYILGYDVPVLDKLLPGWTNCNSFVDTLVVSRLLDYNLSGGHSIEAWGTRLGQPKFHGGISDWSTPTPEMLERCISDVRINYLLYKRFLKYINSPVWAQAIEVEHFTASRCRELHDNGFYFSLDKCQNLWHTLDHDVKELDGLISRAFPPRVVLKRTVEPKLTKHGTLHRGDFRFVKDGDLTPYNGGPFSLIAYEDFNPGSPAQIVERLNQAGWQPTQKTKGHKLALREGNPERIDKFKDTGWTVSEENLATLPDTAPPEAKLLAKRILLVSRQRTLTEWIESYDHTTGRIHGSFNGIGAWTHRMSHVNPNTGNIPREDALYGAEMRRMWSTPDGSWLVGVDAESIQLRVLAHYIDDPQFTQSLLTGRKEDETDPHSLNARALGSACASRHVAKTFIYAWLLGAGIEQVSTILGCSGSAAKAAVKQFIEYYPGLATLKRDTIPADAKHGYFRGFDGRWVKIFGEDQHAREHFCLAGYLQNGESTVMKHALRIWWTKLKEENVPFRLVNFVHDEWQTQVPDYQTGEYVGRVQADAIRQSGEMLELRCPMAGSTLNGHGSIAIGKNWLETH